MSSSTRRTFVQSCAAGWTAASWSRVPQANDRIQLAVIGLGARGREHVSYYAGLKSRCRVAAVCDVYQPSLERGAALAEKESGETPRTYRNMDDLFLDHAVDAVSLALPNHWHALATIRACQAGKDVYVEKPASHTVFEAIQMVKAAQKYERIVQVGLQSRSMPHKRRAIELLRERVIGAVYAARGLCFKRRKSIGHVADSPAPAGLDWDRFLGPAPFRPFNANRFLYNWHWFWDTGNGDIGNQGVHEMDVALWGLNQTVPRALFSSGGKFIYDDDQQTPNTQTAVFRYGRQELTFEVRGLPSGEEAGIPPDENGNHIGNIFLGSDGWMALSDAGFRVFSSTSTLKLEDKPIGDFDTTPHMANFLDAVHSRRASSLTASIETGIISAIHCHLANASYRTGRQLNIEGPDYAATGDAEANRLLKGQYRAPYVVPEQV